MYHFPWVALYQGEKGKLAGQKENTVRHHNNNLNDGKWTATIWLDTNWAKFDWELGFARPIIINK